MQIYRASVGIINWASQQTRPDASFEVMEMSMRFKGPQVNDIIRVGKCIRNIKMNDVTIMFRKLCAPVRLLSWSDAAFANLQDGVSSGAGHVIILMDDNGHCCPLAWNTNKVKRVVKSTLAAEALALEEAIAHALYLQAILKELLVDIIDIVCVVDSNNLLKAVSSSRDVEDKRLRIDVASVKETMAVEGIRVFHVPGNDMIANCLTKRGARVDDLMDMICTGVVPRSVHLLLGLP